VRIEVGYGLEPVLTDALSAQIIQNEILPAFRTGGFQRGITEGVDAIIAQLSLDPAEAQARAAAKPRRPTSRRPDHPRRPGLPVHLVGMIRASRRRRSAARQRRRACRSCGAPRRPEQRAAAEAAAASAAVSAAAAAFRGGGGSFGGGGASGGW
jgi:uncharacterized protein